MPRPAQPSAELAATMARTRAELAALPATGPRRCYGGGNDHPTRRWPRRWEWYVLEEISAEPLMPGHCRMLAEHWGQAFTAAGTRWAVARRMSRHGRSTGDAGHRSGSGWPGALTAGFAVAAAIAFRHGTVLGCLFLIAAAFTPAATLILSIARRNGATWRDLP